MGSLAELIAGKRVLLAVAAPAEANAARMDSVSPGRGELWQLVAIDARFDVVRTGVGKAAAAGGVARVLDPNRHGLVLSVGIAGVLGAAAQIGQTVLATRCDLVDDGIQGPDRFENLEQIGFGPFDGETAGAAVSDLVINALAPLADVTGPVATVSLCSGNDPAAANLARMGYVAEAMEGAAVALVAQRVGVPFGELRVISNTTGKRAMQKWDLMGSLAKLRLVLGRLRAL